MSSPQEAESYGQIFTLESVTQSDYASTFTLEKVQQDGARFVRLSWVDLTNVARCRVIPIRALAHLAASCASRHAEPRFFAGAFHNLLASRRPGLGIAKAVLGLVEVSCAPGFHPTGEYLYTPDMATIRPCTYAPGHVSVMGWFEEKLLEGRNSYSTALCPRTQLKKVLECVFALLDRLCFVISINQRCACRRHRIPRRY
jgi:hypothetical protein